MRVVLLILFAPVLPLLLWACNSHPLAKPQPATEGESQQYRDVNPINKVDILFVIDNSGSMQQEQDNLARNFRAFMNQLPAGGDFHIAVVDTDLGGGSGTPRESCGMAPGGDGARFCTSRGRGDLCANCGVNGRFMTTVPRNFTRELPDTFGCMANYGTDGCSFEHSLEAARRSLMNAANGEFLREDAYLALVVITDEDDCSAPADSTMFAAATPGQEWSLRCSIAGHVCNGQRPMNAPFSFALNNCQPASDGGLIPVDEIVQSIVDLKGDRNKIIVSGIFGWPAVGEGTYALQGGMGQVSVAPVCQSANGSAAPALRVKTFVESFPNNSFHSICQNQFDRALQQIGEKIRVVVGPACIAGVLADGKAQPPGTTKVLDPVCVVSDREPKGNGYTEVVLPACNTNPAGPCWNLVEDATCTGSRHRVEIDRKGTEPPAGTVQSFRCLTCVEPRGCPLI